MVGSDLPVKLIYQILISLSYAGLSALFGNCPDQVQRVFSQARPWQATPSKLFLL